MGFFSSPVACCTEFILLIPAFCIKLCTSCVQEKKELLKFVKLNLN
uniref:Uncharacterized protein n=1 Tax=Arundo donax TaxID=35708 RepID=A0A0A9C0F7_ARUDO